MRILNLKGFTLIELLVAITILGVLGAIGTASFRGLQSKARDSARIQDLKAFATALEIYAQNSPNSNYIITTQPSGQCSDDNSNAFYGAIGPYMANQVAPDDPSTNEKYCYYSENNGASFRLFAKLENCSDPEVIPGGCTPNTYNFSVTSQDLAITGPVVPSPSPTPTPTASPTPPPPPPSCDPGTLRNQLHAYWKMDEASWVNNCSTNTVMDASDNSRHGISCPASTGPLGGAVGKLSNAGDFDGSNDKVIINAPSLPTGDFTYSAWVKVDSLAAVRAIFNSADSVTQDEISVSVNTTGAVRVYTSNTLRVTTTTILSVGTWYNVVVKRAGGTISVYINNGTPAIGTDATTLNFGTCGLTIGVRQTATCGSASAQPMDGIIDEAGIWNRALTDGPGSEVSALYNGGAGCRPNGI